MKVIVIYSGGLDSTVLLTKAVKEYDEVTAVNFNYGSKHNVRERHAAQQICDYLAVELIEVNMLFLGDLFKSALLLSGGDIPEGHYQAESMKSTIVSFRNGIMLSVAAGYAESVDASKVLLASHAGDTIYPDCSVEFNEAMNEAIQFGTTKGIQLEAPFANMSKVDIVKLGEIGNAPMWLSYSCYNGRDKHCGKCGTCVERIESFQLNNLVDEAEYEIDICWQGQQLQ